MRVPERLRDESGAMLVFIALMLIAFLAVFAIAVDVGHWLNTRAEAQRAADAAALAGAGMFMYSEGDPERPANVVAAADKSARTFAAENYVGETMIDATSSANEANPPVYCSDGPQVEVCVDTNRQRVDVLVRGSTSALFSRILGFLNLDVSATAAARVFDAGTASCVKPFAIPDMWDEATQDANGNGIWDFDITPGCNGASCNNEVWSYDPTTGDEYERATTGYASNLRDGRTDHRNRQYTADYGRRIPVKIQNPQNTNVASFWYPWVIPGSEPGINGVIANILDCIPEAQIGGQGDFEVETKNGNAPKPIYDAMRELIDRDPDAYWDDATNQVAYPDGSSSPYRTGWKSGPRVMTVAVFNPEDMDPGKEYMRFVDFVQVFLEDPVKVYGANNENQAHKLPITARMIGYVSGDKGPETGITTKVLQLVK